MNKIYLIEVLWVDPLENNHSDACGRIVGGYATTEEQAKKFCNEAGYYAGTGWPYPVGENIPVKTYRVVYDITSQQDNSPSLSS